MIDSSHLLYEVIRPVLRDIGLCGVAAEALVLGTACQESRCGTWLTQLEHGPARGIYQMEPATHDDIWDRWLIHDQELMKKVNRWRVRFGNGAGADEMVGNLFYATIMCRLHYRRVAAPLPTDLPGQAAYWKQYYNTPAGAGSASDYMAAWRQFAPQMWT